MPTPTRLAVLGAGPAGYPAAFHAADLGLAVTLVDPEPAPGGVCLYRGCIPSKALLHATGVMAAAKAGAAFGLGFTALTLDLDRLRAWQQGVVAKLTGGLAQLAQRRGIRYLRGRARFRDGHTLAVQTAAGAEEAVPFDYALLATGSRPTTLPIAPASPRVMDSTAALALADVPAALLVVGGGYIGLELGQVYAGLGSAVTVVEMLPGLLPGADRDLVSVLLPHLRKQFAAIRLETKVLAMTEVADGVTVTFEDKAGARTTETFGRVLVAVGRRPNTADLGLEQTRVVVNRAGFVESDAQRRTAEPTVFVAGDVAGQPMLAHKATHEARAAVEAIAGRKGAAFAPAAVPAVVFTDPELAWCGLGEEEARAQGREVTVARFPWAASGRAASLGRADGVTKLVCEAGSGRVLGAAMAGPGAGELIAEAVLAVEMGAVAEDLALTVHPHPTLSETLMEAAEAVLGHATHFLGKGA